jgi:outer membrane protein assembly factor BamC
MRNKPVVQTLAVLLAVTLLQSACGIMDKVAPGREKVDYKKSKTIDNLEVPPELSSDTITEAPESINAAEATYSGTTAAQPAQNSAVVLAARPNVRLERDGNQEWLVVQGSPDQIWPRVREFWLEQGFLIKMEDARIGILETDWNENRADIPQGIIRKYIGKAIDSVYSSATRDKYRVRLEHGSDPATTEIFLTHRGVQEVYTGGSVDSPTEWKPRDPDPELEAEMTKRLMVFLGADTQQVQTQLASKPATPARAQLVDEGGAPMLVIKEDFSRAWRRTGVALDRVGFTVDDRDRTSGTYFVKYNDPLGEQEKKGFLSKLAFWSSKEKKEATVYRIVLQANGATTNVIVNDDQGARDKTTTGKRILTLLEEQLR